MREPPSHLVPLKNASLPAFSNSSTSELTNRGLEAIALRDQATDYLAKAQSAHQKRDFGEAIVMCEKALEKTPTFDEAIRAAILCYFFSPTTNNAVFPRQSQSDLTARGLTLCRTCQQLGIQNVDAFLLDCYLGVSLGRMGFHEESIECFERVCAECQPGSTTISNLYLSRAMLSERNGEYAKALEHLDRAEDIDGGYDFIFFLQARVYQKMGQEWPAKENFEQFVKLTARKNPYRQDEIRHAEAFLTE